MLRALALLLNLVLAAIAACQVQIDPNDWKIEYRYEGTKTWHVSTIGTTTDPWEPPDPQPGDWGLREPLTMSAGIPTPEAPITAWCSVQGTISVRISWNRTDIQPPSEAFFVVESTAENQPALPVGATTHNSFGDPNFLERSYGKHLVYVHGDQLPATFAYNLSAKVGQPGGPTTNIASVNVRVWPDPRSVSIRLLGREPTYYKSGEYDSGYHYLIETGEILEYKAYRRKQHEPRGNGLEYVLDADVALPTKLLHSSRSCPFQNGFAWHYHGETWTSLDVQGRAVQQFQAGEQYSYAASSGPTFTDNLPDWPLGTWDIASLELRYTNPLVRGGGGTDGPMLVLNDAGSGDATVFTYRWVDGVSGTAVLTLTLHPILDGGFLLDILPRYGNWRSFPLEDGPGYWTKFIGQESATAIEDPQAQSAEIAAGIVRIGLSLIASATPAGAFWPWGALLVIAAGLPWDDYLDQEPATFKVMRPSGEQFLAAENEGHVIGERPTANPAEALLLYHWAVSYLETAATSYVAYDKYGPTGFEAVEIAEEVRPLRPRDCFPRRFWFLRWGNPLDGSYTGFPDGQP